MRILVVDDSTVMRKIVIKALADAGHRDILEATNGQQALGMAQNADIVFTDWEMPVMDGLTFVKELRKVSQVPVIMITTEGSHKQVLEAMKSGVNDYVVKPFKASVLLSKVQYLMKLITRGPTTNSSPRN